MSGSVASCLGVSGRWCVGCGSGAEWCAHGSLELEVEKLRWMSQCWWQGTVQEFGDHGSPVVGVGVVVLRGVVVGPAGAESDHAEEFG